MFDSVFEIVQKGLFKEVHNPVYGKQHQGIAPGGAMDLFSFRMGNALLKRDKDPVSLEIIIAPVFRFKQDCWFALTGARYDRVTIGASTAGEPITVPHGAVFPARSGDALSFGSKITGFRTYLSITPVVQTREDLSSRRQPDYSQMYRWIDPQGYIRVLEGPEYDYLTDKTLFTNSYWVISNDFSDMGFRLLTRDRLPEVNLKNMISEAVADGTVQLTPKGPIVLLKHRQTVGGYPRIYNVISADVDLLAQYSPNQILRFSKVTLDQAFAIAHDKESTLTRLS